MDLAVAGMNSLRPGTVLDGEAVIYNEGMVDFAAAQSRAASGPARARELAAVLPASYAVWDLLAHPELGDVQSDPVRGCRASTHRLCLGEGASCQLRCATGAVRSAAPLNAYPAVADGALRQSERGVHGRPLACCLTSHVTRPAEIFLFGEGETRPSSTLRGVESRSVKGRPLR
jgi:hypothetical protein